MCIKALEAREQLEEARNQQQEEFAAVKKEEVMEEKTEAATAGAAVRNDEATQQQEKTETPQDHGLRQEQGIQNQLMEVPIGKEQAGVIVKQEGAVSTLKQERAVAKEGRALQICGNASDKNNMKSGVVEVPEDSGAQSSEGKVTQKRTRAQMQGEDPSNRMHLAYWKKFLPKKGLKAESKGKICQIISTKKLLQYFEPYGSRYMLKDGKWTPEPKREFVHMYKSVYGEDWERETKILTKFARAFLCHFVGEEKVNFAKFAHEVYINNKNKRKKKQTRVQAKAVESESESEEDSEEEDVDEMDVSEAPVKRKGEELAEKANGDKKLAQVHVVLMTITQIKIQMGKMWGKLKTQLHELVE